MSIKDRRFDKVVDKILREELQRGNLPSSKEFISRVNQYIQENDLTKPSLRFAPIRKGGAANAQQFNENLDHLYEDMETLYISVVDQHASSIKHFNKFEIEKSKLEYELKTLENQLKDLVMLYGGTGFLNSLYDVFVDLTNVDTEKTTANVDIAKHEVRINDLKQMTKKILPVASTSFQVATNISPAPQIETISGTTDDALSDKQNAVWQTRVLTTSNIAVPTSYNVAFDTAQEINRITLSLETIKPVRILIELSNDNVNWFKLPYYEKSVLTQDIYTFDFPMIKARYFRIKMTKDEPDNETLIKVNNEDQVRYSYLFGIKNLSFYTYIYSTSSDLYSVELDADPESDTNFTINKVSLLVDEELPNGTDIKYYIALPQTSGEPEWKAISPVDRKNPQYDQMIDFKNISTSVPNTFSINPSISIGEYELENLYAYGIRFYKIGEIVDRKIIDGTERLFVGKNTWGVKKYTFQHTDHATHLPSLEDWRKPTNVGISYVKISDGKPGLLLNKEATSTATNYMFTLGVFSEQAKDIIAAIPASTDPIAIYMNGNLLFQGIPSSANKLNFLFQNGWNEILVLVYTRNSTGTVNGATVDINFDPRSHGSSVYSQTKPLQKVSIFDLRYNVLNNDYNKFALIEVNNKTQVVINHAIPGLEYEFYYNYIDGAVKDKILFKATLLRDDSITEASPKLKSYRLRFS